MMRVFVRVRPVFGTPRISSGSVPILLVSGIGPYLALRCGSPSFHPTSPARSKKHSVCDQALDRQVVPHTPVQGPSHRHIARRGRTSNVARQPRTLVGGTMGVTLTSTKTPSKAGAETSRASDHLTSAHAHNRCSPLYLQTPRSIARQSPLLPARWHSTSYIAVPERGCAQEMDGYGCAIQMCGSGGRV